MPSKLPLTARSLFKKITLLLILGSLKMTGQTRITTIHTDWNGYWKSTALTGAGNRPDTENNLLAFEWNSKTYSTGVNDNILNTKAVTYNAQKYRALKIQTLGLDPGGSMYFLQGSKIDGDNAIAKLTPALAGTTSTGTELASRLTDGVNGLTLGTGIANIKSGTAEFKVGTNNLNIAGLNDNIPDLIVTQVAEPGGTADSFKFIDKDGNIVGHSLSTNFGSIAAVGTYSLDLFRADNAAPAFTPAATRDIRMLGIETSEFGITTANAADVDRFVVTFSGSSDCAFIAFNTNSLKIAELSLVTKSTLTSCGKVGDKINYTFEVTNVGQVPITEIKVTDLLAGMTITGNPVASLAVGAKVTLTGVYTLTATDVSAGKVVNLPRVTGIDPSLNTVDDVNTPVTTILLAPPTIGTVTNVLCTALGTVALSGLPAGETWTIVRTPGAVPTTGTGTTTTITEIPAGKYTFTVSTLCFKSPSSAEITITDQSSTTWNGTVWSNGDPISTKGAIFTGPFTITADLNACSCTINSGVNILVPSGLTLNVTNAVTVKTGASLTFQNNASLLQTNTGNNINTGNITYNRNTTPVRRYDFTHWSSPVSSSSFTLHDLSPNTLADKYYKYDQTAGWILNYNGTFTMTPGVGYIVRAPQTFDINVPSVCPVSFVGIPNNGNITVTPVLASKWILIGNPYPSALNAEKFMSINSNTGSLYFWTHTSKPASTVGSDNTYQYNTNDYAVFNFTGGVGVGNPGGSPITPTGMIASGVAFFVKPSSSADIVFTNYMREIGNNTQFFKTTKSNELEKNRVWLNFTNAQGVFKQTLVGYIEGATNSWDTNYDAATINGNEYADFYTINNTENLSVQGRALPFDNTDQVPLGYKTTIAGDFTISIDHADGLFNNQKVYLEDKTSNTIHDLTAGDYTFTTAIGTFGDRFTLRYTNKTLGTGDFENLNKSVLVSVKDKVIKVNSTQESIKEVSIYDISGKVLYNKKKVSSTELQISNLQSANQVLVVKVILDNNYSTTEKVIFE